MAVSYVFEKPAQQEPVPAQPLVEQTASQLLAGELISLDRKLVDADVPEILKRIEVIKKELQSIAKDAVAPDLGWVIEAPNGVVTVSKCAEKIEIKDLDGLIQYIESKLGHNAVLAVLSAQLTSLRKILGENEIHKFSETVPGARTIKVAHKDGAT
jgi:hypothetical protein